MEQHRAESAPLSWRTTCRKSSHSSDYRGEYKRTMSYSSDNSDKYGELPSSFCGRGNGNSEKTTRQDYEVLEQRVLDYFGKKFYFEPPMENWVLPHPSSLYISEKWQVRN